MRAVSVLSMTRWMHTHESENMTSPHPVRADSTAGESLLGSTDVLTIDPDQLRSLSRSMEGLASQFSALAAEVEGLNATVSEEAARFTRKNAPAPIYAQTVEGVVHTNDKYNSELRKLSDQLRYDAGGLLWIADQRDADEADAQGAYESVDSDVYTV